MKLRLVPLSIAAACMLGIDPAAAQDSRTVTFDEAVGIALQQNVGLLKAQNEVGLQYEEVKRAKAQFLPNLNLSSSPNINWGLGFDFTTGELVSERTEFGGITASTSIPLFTGFNNMASLEQAKLDRQSSTLRYSRQEQTVYFDVTQSFLQVLLEKERIKIRDEDLTAQTRQLERIEEFTNVGTRPISDLYQQQATVANSELQLLETERALHLAEARLIQVLQLDPTEVYDFSAPGITDVSLDVDTYDLDRMLGAALERRMDLQALDTDIMASEQQQRIAKSSRFPTVTLRGSSSTNYSSRYIDLETGKTASWGDQLKDNRAGSVGLSINIPIFNRRFSKINEERAKVQYSNLQLDRQNLEQTIALEVRQAYLDYLTAAKRLDVTEKQLISARQAEAVETERYNIGASTLVELQQARAAFVDAASQRAQAVAQFLFADSVIDYYLGTLNPNQPVFE
jgi:outer membrane protein